MTKLKKRISPFSQEFWIAKGYTKEEADYKRNSIRPIKPEYWLERGMNMEDAIQKAKETKEQNNKKGLQAAIALPYEKRMYNSALNVDHWMRQGYTREEAQLKVSDRQRTFTLEKCIEKYGIVEGTNRWQQRQDKWQNTLKSKDIKEQNEINTKKNSIGLKNYSSVEECIEVLAKSRNMKLTIDLADYRNIVLDKIKESPYIQYMHASLYVDSYVSKVQLEILNLTKEELAENLKDIFHPEKYLFKKGNKQSYNLRTEEGLLRSSYEIYFYENLNMLFPDIHVKIDKPYPNSNFRFDFYVFGDYIEICPMYNKKGKEAYTIKMNKKKNLFNCVLLTNIQEIDSYLKDKMNANNCR